jgi:hypothetical protein
MTVDAEELCTRQVTVKPVVSPEKRVPFMACMMARRRSPASRCRASDITFIPNRNKPKLPRRVKILIIGIEKDVGKVNGKNVGSSAANDAIFGGVRVQERVRSS